MRTETEIKIDFLPGEQVVGGVDCIRIKCGNIFGFGNNLEGAIKAFDMALRSRQHNNENGEKTCDIER